MRLVTGISIVLLAVLGALMVACASPVPPTVESTQNIDATLEAKINLALAKIPRVEPTPNIDATVEAKVDLALAKIPKVEPTPNVDATEESKVVLTLAKIPTMTHMPAVSHCPKGSESWCRIAESDGQQNQSLNIISTIVPAPTSVPATTPRPTTVSLKGILDLRDANEVAADSKYIGMYVRMNGVITQIHENDIFIIPVGSDPFQMSGAKCKFNKSQLPDLLALRKGQTITLIGTIESINDFMFNSIEVKPCQFR